MSDNPDRRAHIIISSCKIGQLPDPDDFLRIVSIYAQNEIALTLHIVDIGVHTDDILQRYQEMTENVEIFPGRCENYEYAIDLNGTQINFRDNTLDQMIFIDYSGLKNTYALPDKFIIANNINRYFSVQSDTAPRLNLDKLMEEFIFNENHINEIIKNSGEIPEVDTIYFENVIYFSPGDYKMYSRLPLQKYYWKEDVEEIFNTMSILNDRIKCFLKENFLDSSSEQTLIKGLGWFCNVRAPDVEGLLRDSEIKTSAPDKKYQDEFNTSKEFRRYVASLCMYTVINFCINNNLLNILEINDWYNLETYDLISTNLKIGASNSIDVLVCRSHQK
jgi:hypothetical protein